MTDESAGSFVRVVGLVLVVASILWMAFSVLFGLGLAIAWISETGLTDELQSWVLSVLVVGALSTAIGYAVFVVGRGLRSGR
jgi:hypothetical protein